MRLILTYETVIGLVDIMFWNSNGTKRKWQISEENAVQSFSRIL